VADTPLHFTKREMRALVTSRTVWIGLVTAGIVLGLAGPFGTCEVMRIAPRLAYWMVVAVVTFLSGSAVATYVSAGMRARALPRWPSVAVAGVVAGGVVLAEIAALNWAAFGVSPAQAGYLPTLAVNVVVISVLIATAIVLIRPAPLSQIAVAPAPSAPVTPKIVDRLPFDRRGALVSMTTQDHYVEVTTTGGRDLVLIRLSDAIAETAPAKGLQVHRSHWVALDQVRAARRDGGKVVLTLADGRDIPVSRTYVPAVKEAGLLPV